MSHTPALSPDFVQQVTTACRHFDKPARLGDLLIAGPALRAALLQNPAHPTDRVGRGLALQQAIQHTLMLLQPTEKDVNSRDKEIYLCLYAHIHKRDPFLNKPIGNVADYIEARYHISRANYFHRKDEGMERLGVQLSAYLAVHATLLEPIPTTANFVGRGLELARIRDALATQRLAVIEGVWGIGKTALGAQLVATFARPVCWLTLRAGLNANLSAVVHTWAAFLAGEGAPHLWAFLNAGGDFNLARSLPALRQDLETVKPLLCLDNVESFATEDTAFWSLLEAILSIPDIAMLLMSRRRPALPQLGDYPLLSGLAPDEVELLAQRHKLMLAPPQAATLTTYTGGNPRLLELSFVYLQAQMPTVAKPDFAAALSRLAGLPAIAHYLVTETLGALSTGEREAAHLLTFARRPLDGFVLREPPETWALENVGITPEDFIGLQKRGLIHIDPGEQWSLTPLLSDYLKQQPLEAARRVAFHQVLVQLYSLLDDPLETTYHLAQSGQMNTAVDALARDYDVLVRRGQAAAMLAVLRLGTPDAPAIQSVWHDLQVELLRLLGDYAAAEVVASEMERVAEGDVARAHALHVRGQVAEARGQKMEAITHYRHATALLYARQSVEEAWLYRDLAWVLSQTDDLALADQEAQRAEMALENTWGIIARHRGDLETALQHLDRAVTLAEAQNAPLQLSRARNNRASVYRELAHYGDAIHDYEQNLLLVEQTGEVVAKAITLLNIGIAHTLNGTPARAVTSQMAALILFERLGDALGCYLAHTNLAEAYLALEDLSKARLHAESDAQGKISASHQAERQRVYAEILLAQGDCEAASAAITQTWSLLYPDGPDGAPLDASKAGWAHETLRKINAACGG